MSLSSAVGSGRTIGVVGTVVLDHLMYVEDFAGGSSLLVDDGVSRVSHVEDVLGGKGMVCARAMLHQGAQVLPLFGLDTQNILASMWPEGMSQDTCDAAQDAAHEAWIVVRDARGLHTFISLASVSKRSPKLDPFLAAIDYLYISYEDVSILKRLLADLGRPGCRPSVLALNATAPLILELTEKWPEGLLKLLEHATVVLLNEGEERLLFEALGANSWNQVVGPDDREVVVTQGAAGGRWLAPGSGDWRRFNANVVAMPVCLVGAGDTFNGAYLVARWLDAKDIGESCAEAATLAALKIRTRSSSL